MDAIAIKELIDNVVEVKETPALIRLRANVKRKNFKPKETQPIKETKPKEFNYENFWSIAGVKQHAQFEQFMRDVLFKREERERFYDGLVELLPDLSVDSFKPYFELYSAERKSFQQDYTPNELADLLSKLTRSDVEQHQSAKYSAYDATAGTGSLIISKWHDDRIQETPWSYAPHRYFYRADELADNAVPYLIHNLAMRGMNAIVIHGDSLMREVKQIYFIQNSNDNYMGYSDINVMPHDKQTAKEFSVAKWLEPAIDHMESQKVYWDTYVLPMRRRGLEINQDAMPGKPLKALNHIKLKHLAHIERAKQNYIYPEGSIVIQLSATRGQTGLLKSSGSVGTQYAVVICNYPLDRTFAYYYLKEIAVPRHFHRVQEGLNVKLEEIGNIPIMLPIKGQWFDCIDADGNYYQSSEIGKQLELFNW